VPPSPARSRVALATAAERARRMAAACRRRPARGHCGPRRSRTVSAYISSVPCFPPRLHTCSPPQPQAERKLSPPHTAARSAGVELPIRTAISRLHPPAAPPRPSPTRAPALYRVRTLVSPVWQFSSAAVPWPPGSAHRGWRLPTLPLSPLGRFLYSPSSRGARAHHVGRYDGLLRPTVVCQCRHARRRPCSLALAPPLCSPLGAGRRVECGSGRHSTGDLTGDDSLVGVCV
jgi:hypothetical protein